MSRSEMVELATKVFNIDGSDDEIDAALFRLKSMVPHGNISDLIFYPDAERTPEQIVDEALRREKEYAARATHNDIRPDAQ